MITLHEEPLSFPLFSRFFFREGAERVCGWKKRDRQMNLERCEVSIRRIRYNVGAYVVVVVYWKEGGVYIQLQVV